MEKYAIKHAALTDIGLKRSINEDAIGFIEIEHGYVFVVCDGMGGHEGGEIASKTAVRGIIEYLNINTIENASISLHQAILYANQQVYTIAQNNPELRGMGTTAVVLLIYKDEIHTAHVGDSRIYVHDDNKLIQITKDHSVVQDMVDNGIILQEEAETHPRKNEITKALGIKESVSPTISSKPIKAKKGDRFIICSDGLSGMVNKIQLTSLLSQFTNPDECAEQLIKSAKEVGGDDNISVQVIDITNSPFEETVYPNREKTIKPLAEQKPLKKKISKKIIPALIALALITASCIFIYQNKAADKSSAIEKSAKSIKDNTTANNKTSGNISAENGTRNTTSTPSKTDTVNTTTSKSKSNNPEKSTQSLLAKNNKAKDSTKSVIASDDSLKKIVDIKKEMK